MTKIFLPLHYDGDNRGCEAITKGTSILLGLPEDKIIALSNNVELDIKLGLNKYVKLIPVRPINLLFKIKKKIIGFFKRTNLDKLNIQYEFKYKNFLNSIQIGDVLLSTGGDMFCYGDNDVIYTNEYAQKRGVKTILWGCSIGSENLSPNKLRVLRGFDCIYVRESLTAEVLRNERITNIVNIPDPAFILKAEPVKLPTIFKEGDVIGINLSKYTVGGDNLETVFGRQVKELIDFVVKETTYHILLIPHVLWKNQDDRLLLSNVYKLYKDTKRVSILNSEDYNYCQLRYIIGNCTMFIGGRTHSVISAYSTCTPAIALGYSIKSKGIAIDLGMPEESVVDTKTNGVNRSLLSSFVYVDNHKKEIKEHLISIMPSYIEKMRNVKNIIKD